MAETSAKSNNLKPIEIQYTGWNEAVAKSFNKKNKMDDVKSKILSTIEKNIEFYATTGKNLSPTVRILKDAEEYTTIILRCGTFPIWRNTVRKGVYSEIDVLNDLKNKVNADFFKNEIEAYLNKGKNKASVKKISVKKSTLKNLSE